MWYNKQNVGFGDKNLSWNPAYETYWLYNFKYITNLQVSVS